MRWEDREGSSNVEDRRGMVSRRTGVGCGGLLLVVVIAWLTGANPSQLLGLLGLVEQMVPPAGEPQAPAGTPPAADPQARFVGVVLKDTDDAWGAIFARSGGEYEKPRLVLFEREVASACGFTSSAVGPFYCPSDRKVYLDLSFFRELASRFGAPGDFAQAYVVAHEVGHHVQNLLGISERVSAMQRRAGSEEEANALSVRLELQADCFAGVWGRTAAARDPQFIEEGDIEEGLRAAAAIGDDRIQSQAQGYVVPESWTHGSSEMRVRWFRRGLQGGDAEACDAFETRGR